MILDTNAFSAWADGDEAVASLEVGDRPLLLPGIVVGEWLYGVRGSRHRTAYERWYAQHRAAWTVLEVGEETARHYALIRAELKAAGTPIPANALWIAALCREHESSIASRDEHFDAVKGLQRIAW